MDPITTEDRRQARRHPLFHLWLCLICITPPAVAAGTNDWVFLDNGQIRLGVTMNYGAGIGWLSASGSERNLINHWDSGRLVQQSYYGQKDGSLWDKQPWRWNPVQGGDWRGDGAKVLDLRTGTNWLYARTLPKHWASGADLPEVTMEEWISLAGKMARVRFQMTYTGQTAQPKASQEIPALFAAPDLNTLALYDGPQPWSNGALSRTQPGWPNEDRRMTEHWAAYVDTNDFGVGAYVPAADHLTCYRFGNGQAQDGACSYFAPLTEFAITPGKVFAYDLYLTLGGSGEIRETFRQIHDRTVSSVTYVDGRPRASLRLEAKDQGVVLKHGGGPGDCDKLGAREAIVYMDRGIYYLHYDGAGPRGWLACLATSRDLVHWEKKGANLDFGKPGSPDSASASSPWVIQDGNWWRGKTWHMFYLGTPRVTPAPNYIPMFPYQTLTARGKSPAGPWEKLYDKAPFTTRPGTYYSSTASPGFIVKSRGEFLMFFSAGTAQPEITRTLSIARAKNLDGPWTVRPTPILPPGEQVENSSLYYEPKIKTWFLFTNHIGINERREEFTDAIWVFWSKDLNEWDPENKAVVLDGQNCSWSRNCIGMPSVIKFGRRLAVLYDAPGGDSLSHMNRDIGLAWLDLPLHVPVEAAE